MGNRFYRGYVPDGSEARGGGGAPSGGKHAAPEAPKKKASGKKIGLVVGIVAAALVVAYIGMGVFFTSHFGFNTSINGQDVSFKTLDQVESILKNQVDTYELTIQKIDGTSEVLKGSDIGLTYQSDNRAAELLSNQHAFAWATRVASAADPVELHPDVTYNQQELTTALNKLDLMQAANQVAPTDATVGYDAAASQYVVVPEQWGSTINTDVFYAAVTAAVEDTRPTIDLKAANCYVAPAVYSDDAGLASKAAACNEYARGSIVYDLGSKGTLELSGSAVADWLVQGDDGTYTIDDDSIRSWVKENLSANLDTVGSSRSFTTATGSSITVSGGTYGWKVDVDDEVSQIKEDLESAGQVTREPVWSSKAVSHTQPEWGSTYVEVSIPAQHVWYIVNGSVAFDSDVVTGLPTAKRATCTGVYSILEKQSPSVLRGPQKPDGTYEWESPVNYWMRITWSGTGLHDANWRSSFGGTIYQSNGSHGCVNMPPAKAQELYSMLSVGTPVIMY
ncbi:MAG: L,D-transpeptidase family protein [Coriobacteriales bacterium]|nr:L,D-transpeptidase family protein [Coriobacteriales bacterium]